MSEISIAEAENYTFSVEIEELSNLIQTRIQNSALHSATPGRCSIHRVPEKFHKMTEPSQYKPQVISIGPFHRKDQSLKAMEDLKLFYAHHLLTRTAEKNIKEEVVATTSRPINLDSPGTLVKKPGWVTILDECIQSIKKKEPEIRDCYSEAIDLSSGEFVDMMVIDGLFIIEDFIRAFAGRSIDLLLLENQLPFFVLQCLFDHIALPDQFPKTVFLWMMVFHRLKFCLRMLPTEKNLVERAQPLPEECQDAKHLLDILCILLQPSPQSDKHVLEANLPSSSTWKIQKNIALLEKFNRGACASTNHEYEVHLIPRATDLKRAGVRFKRGSQKADSMSFKFSSDGIFEISPISIDDGTDTILRNIIAFEQLYSGRSDMSCYAVLMDCLINSVEDVEILRQVGIINNHLGCDEDVVNIFNKLCVDVFPDSRYNSTTHEVNKFYNQSWSTWKAMLKSEYFHNPWAIVSVFAAVLLILLTLTSTVTGILQVT
ncbi:hypothetical protein MKW98_028105 [Papaver atlanticum]|uniref:Uncharacterized protein n=1 Tax=Papaver atlanticum TaxID=357466 RepID=A0AAD4SYT3_9MAGN|nr:hypothetical protein MKW98_028105 [Papaver atlanticum]